MACSISGGVHGVASKTASCSEAKVKVSSRVRFLGMKRDSGGEMASEKRKSVRSPVLTQNLNASLDKRYKLADEIVREGLSHGVGQRRRQA